MFFVTDCLCTCQCYIESIKPSLKENTSYEIEKLTIKFSKKVEIHSDPSCASYFNTDLDVTFNCEGRYYNGTCTCIFSIKYDFEMDNLVLHMYVSNNIKKLEIKKKNEYHLSY